MSFCYSRPDNPLKSTCDHSPLALPVMKLPPNAVPMISPREKALRSKVSPRVQSFIHPQRASPRPQPAVSAGATETATGGTVQTEPGLVPGREKEKVNNGGDGGEPSVSEVVDEVEDAHYVTVSDITHTPQHTTNSAAQEITEEIHVPEALELLDTAQNSVIEEAGTQDSSVALDPPQSYPDSPTLNLHSGNNSISSPPSPQRKISPRAEPNYLKAPQRYSPRGGSTDAAHIAQRPTKSIDSSRTPSPRGKFEQTQPTTQRSPLRSPRQDPYSSKTSAAIKTNPKHKNAVNKHHLEETLTSHSAPGTVATAKPSTIASAVTESTNLNLNLHMEEDMADSASAPSSPGRRAKGDQIKKRIVLKNLNEKSNLSSPRDKSDQDRSPTDGFNNTEAKLSEDLLTAADISSATVGEASPPKYF